jgi:hypothetical protein
MKEVVVKVRETKDHDAAELHASGPSLFSESGKEYEIEFRYPDPDGGIYLSRIELTRFCTKVLKALEEE